ncbi:hypothetical protein [Streptomyces narbonensis]
MRARPSSAPSRPTSSALSGKGVHLITVNDDLAERDSELDWAASTGSWDSRSAASSPT